VFSVSHLGTERDVEARMVMRTDLLLIAAALAVSASSFVTTPNADQALEGDRSAQAVGPLPSPALNPRLGTDPPGGSLRDRGAGPGTTGRPVDPVDPRPADRRVDPAEVPGGRDGVVPANPAGRLGTMDGGHLGAPPANAVPDAPVGAVPPPPTGAVPPPPGPNVAPQAPAQR
jgi:hypothetical protein